VSPGDFSGRAAPAAAFLLLGLFSAALPAPAPAIEAVPADAPAAPRLTVDVWINKEEGGIYQPGESMRVFFRPSADAFVLVYNIDTEGYVHLVYPYGPNDPIQVEANQTLRIPARHDPYDLVADGPPGVEYVVAVASEVPFQKLPWYLSGDPDGGPPPDDAAPGDDLESGVIVGDPYVGMQRINRRILQPGAGSRSASSETFFYIHQRVEYPRYVCADCHYSGFSFDPYLGACPVVAVQVDATWVRYTPMPVPVTVVRPRYYYTVRTTAPDRYRAWKERWSTLDGTAELRSKFVAEPGARTVRRQADARPRPPAAPQEFRNLRRQKPGRLWIGRDEILRLRESVPAPERNRVQPGSERKNRGQKDQKDQKDQNEQEEKKEKSPPPKSGNQEKSKPHPRENDRDDSTPPPKGYDKQRGRGH
jgi:hypothetical protein